MKIQMSDLKGTGYCRKGIQKWLQDRGYDYQSFIDSGLEDEELLKWNDEMVNKIVRAVKLNGKANNRL